MGGIIVLALNNDANAVKKGKVGYETYLVFIALQCLAAPIALFLTPPEKVQRADGSRVIVKAEKSFKAEFVALYQVRIVFDCRRALLIFRQVCKRREIILLLPVFWAAYFNQYAGNFQTYYFGVRARALIGMQHTSLCLEPIPC